MSMQLECNYNEVNSTEESLKDETRLRLLWVSLVVTLYVHPYNICGEASAYHYGKERSFYKTYSVFIVMCILLVFQYIFSFHNKQCAGDWKDFTFVKFTTNCLCGAKDLLKDQTRLKLFWVCFLVTLYTFLFAYIIDIHMVQHLLYEI